MKKCPLLFSLVLLFNSAFAQVVPSYVPTDSLLGWYPFNGNANNAFGTGKNGIPLGGCVLTTDRFGSPNSAYHFNGDSSHILIDTAFFNVGWHSYSISNWGNDDTLNDPILNGQSQAMFNTIPHNGIDINVNWNSSNKYNFFVNSDPSLVSWDILYADSSKATLTGSTHQWRHFVFMKNNDSTYSFYLNGQLDTIFHNNTLTAVNYYCSILLGHIDTIHLPEAFSGSLDDYGIWNRALASCEVRRLYFASPYTYITTQPANVSVAPGSVAHITEVDTGAGNSYQWQVNSGTGFTNLAGTAPYSGVTTPTLTITPVTIALNAYKYRCVVSGAQVCVDTSVYATLTVVTTGIGNAPNENISISPNPTTGNITITGAGRTNIKVYNEIGRLIKQATQAESISIAEFPTGLYLLKLFDEHGILMYSSKVVRQ